MGWKKWKLMASTYEFLRKPSCRYIRHCHGSCFGTHMVATNILLRMSLRRRNSSPYLQSTILDRQNGISMFDWANSVTMTKSGIRMGERHIAQFWKVLGNKFNINYNINYRYLCMFVTEQCRRFPNSVITFVKGFTVLNRRSLDSSSFNI
jgi:hypothetical protein